MGKWWKKALKAVAVVACVAVAIAVPVVAASYLTFTIAGATVGATLAGIGAAAVTGLAAYTAYQTIVNETDYVWDNCMWYDSIVYGGTSSSSRTVDTTKRAICTALGLQVTPTVKRASSLNLVDADVPRSNIADDYAILAGSLLGVHKAEDSFVTRYYPDKYYQDTIDYMKFMFAASALNFSSSSYGQLILMVSGNLYESTAVKMGTDTSFGLSRGDDAAAILRGSYVQDNNNMLSCSKGGFLAPNIIGFKKVVFEDPATKKTHDTGRPVFLIDDKEYDIAVTMFRNMQGGGRLFQMGLKAEGDSFTSPSQSVSTVYWYGQNDPYSDMMAIPGLVKLNADESDSVMQLCFCVESGFGTGSLDEYLAAQGHKLVQGENDSFVLDAKDDPHALFRPTGDFLNRLLAAGDQNKVPHHFEDHKKGELIGVAVRASEDKLYFETYIQVRYKEYTREYGPIKVRPTTAAVLEDNAEVYAKSYHDTAHGAYGKMNIMKTPYLDEYVEYCTPHSYVRTKISSSNPNGTLAYNVPLRKIYEHDFVRCADDPETMTGSMMYTGFFTEGQGSPSEFNEGYIYSAGNTAFYQGNSFIATSSEQFYGREEHPSPYGERWRLLGNVPCTAAIMGALDPLLVAGLCELMYKNGLSFIDKFTDASIAAQGGVIDADGKGIGFTNLLIPDNATLAQRLAVEAKLDAVIDSEGYMKVGSVIPTKIVEVKPGEYVASQNYDTKAGSTTLPSVVVPRDVKLSVKVVEPVECSTPLSGSVDLVFNFLAKKWNIDVQDVFHSMETVTQDDGKWTFVYKSDPFGTSAQYHLEEKDLPELLYALGVSHERVEVDGDVYYRIGSYFMTAEKVVTEYVICLINKFMIERAQDIAEAARDLGYVDPPPYLPRKKFNPWYVAPYIASAGAAVGAYKNQEEK